MELTAAVCCRSILVGLASNETLEGVELNLSSNALGAPGCQVLEGVVADIHCLASLDISDNGQSLLYIQQNIYFINADIVWLSIIERCNP